MATATVWPSTTLTAADLTRLFGPMPLHRLRFDPPPGTATEKDVLAVYRREKRLCELVEGVLVEKTMGIEESYLAVEIGSLLRNFVKRHKLGMVLGADGMARLAPGLVRIPDVSFVSWDRLPRRAVPRQPMLTVTLDLAVEVLSPTNTRKEMARKLRDYFNVGVRLVWYVDPADRTVTVYTAVNRFIILAEADTLDGGDVLPGLRLSLRELFADLEAPPDQSPAGGDRPPGKARKNSRKRKL